VDTQSFEAHALPGYLVFDAIKQLNTVFLDPKYYVTGMNLQDPRIVEGMRITEAVLRTTKQELNSLGIRFVVVLVPTKHTVYAELMQTQQSQVPDSYFELVEMERRLTDEFTSFLRSENIEFVTTTSALRSCLNRAPPLPSHLEHAPQYQRL
jgi:hypothetical protein